MNRLLPAVLSLWLVILAGCGSDYRVAPVASPESKQAPASRPSKAPAPTPPAAAPAPPASASDEESDGIIKLTTGVALAQTLPDGTMMGFSVDYHFVGGLPSPKAKYLWVIERGNGESVKVETPLQFRGNLSTFVPWRPADGPFRSHLEDAKGTKLSKSVKMK